MHYSVCYMCSLLVCSAELMLPISRCSRVWSLHRQISVRGTLHNQASFYGWPSHQWKGQPPVGDSCHLCVRAPGNQRQNISLSLLKWHSTPGRKKIWKVMQSYINRGGVSCALKSAQQTWSHPGQQDYCDYRLMCIFFNIFVLI